MVIHGATVATTPRSARRVQLREAGRVSSFSVKYVGPAAQALHVATALADADGVELVSSDRPVTVEGNTVALNVTVEGAFDEVADAVARLRGVMPPGGSIEIVAG
jgi:hypothetical protein